MNRRLRAGLPLLLDILIPIAGYFVLHAAGVGDFWALTVPGIATAIFVLGNTLRRGRLDATGTLVVAEIALSVALLLTTRDPRIALIKPAFYTGLGGLYVLYTCFAGRPFVFEASKPFATAGEPERERAFERAWRHSAGFRREQRLITAVWGLLWLAESVIRVVLVLHSTVSHAVLVGQLPAVVAVLVGIVFTRLRIPQARRYVAEQQVMHHAERVAVRQGHDADR